MRSAPRWLLAIALFGSATASAAEVAILSEANWSEFAPGGKEVDAIYGDIVIRDDKLVAVIANPVDGRNANMTMKNVGGCLIDFTTRTAQNDQLGAFYPLGKAVNWRSYEIEPPLGEGRSSRSAKKIVVTVKASLANGLIAETRYVMDAEPIGPRSGFLVDTTISNPTDADVKYSPTDETVVQGTWWKDKRGDFSWWYDRWWNAAYGMTLDNPSFDTMPAQSFRIRGRQWIVAGNGSALNGWIPGTIAKSKGINLVVVTDENKQPIAGAYVEVMEESKLRFAGKTDAAGRFSSGSSEPGEGTVSHPAHGKKPFSIIESETRVVLPSSGTVAAAITDEAGKPIPCKVQFRGTRETKDPEFFDKTGEHAVGNLYYSHDGKFTLDLPPGTYDVTVSHGPEYDIVEQKLEIKSDKTASLTTKLVRSVQTPGWISADFHNHASPSGDNSSSQYGRVLNLLTEHVEFAPCTEHNRISSYLPHLKRLGAQRLMATCSGIELTSSPFSTNHHNAFPLKLHEHKQDGGGPAADPDTEVSVERLVLLDDRSPKLIQQNHPDIGYLFFDKNADGKPDGGFERALGHLDCLEVHPPHLIFASPTQTTKWSASANNPMFNWLQLVNQGYRIPGVVNTDAHYNIHGSGWLRNYIRCDTDDPAEIDVAEMVHNAEHGHMVMTNAPYLEVKLRADAGEKRPPGIPGSQIKAPGGKATLHVRVQCANWYDIDRVQVFINGRPDPKFNFTRAANPDAFSAKTVRFDREIPLELPGDVHLIVATIGENSGLGYVMGPEHADDPPCAVSNPIFVDVDGGGFQANKDTLGAPLPVKDPKSK